MQVRQPRFDFSRSHAHWAPNAEFAQAVNAVCVGIPPLERFLNRVMARARKELTGANPLTAQVRSDITTFIRQESIHHASHDAMIERIVADGYDGIVALTAEIEAHYARLLAKKSLRFLVAYCEGFETIGPVAAMAWCGDKYDHLLAGADPNVAMMMRWHFLEEYEHRAVCFDTHEALGGGYFLRISCFLYQHHCLRKYSNKVERYLIGVDQARMTPEERKASRARHRAVVKLMRPGPIGFLKAFGKVLKPGYRPHGLPKPSHLDAVRDAVDREWLGATPATV